MIVSHLAFILSGCRNTPAVCRSAYICPDVLDSFERGRVIERYFQTVEELVNYRGRHLHQAERALLRLLKRKNDGNSPYSYS